MSTHAEQQPRSNNQLPRSGLLSSSPPLRRGPGASYQRRSLQATSPPDSSPSKREQAPKAAEQVWLLLNCYRTSALPKIGPTCPRKSCAAESRTDTACATPFLASETQTDQTAAPRCRPCAWKPVFPERAFLPDRSTKAFEPNHSPKAFPASPFTAAAQTGPQSPRSVPPRK